MRIFIDQFVYDQRNIGNMSLLQTAVNRLSKLWPGARIDVLTESPYSLKLYCPKVHPVSYYNTHNWSSRQNKTLNLHHALPLPLIRLLLEAREELSFRRSRLPSFNSTNQSGDKQVPIQNSVGALDKSCLEAGSNSDIDQAIQHADLVVASGGGYMVDSDSTRSLIFLDRLAKAIKLNKPTVMVGQGMDILNNPALVLKAKEVLPTIDLIFYREKLVAPKVLASLGVMPDRTVMTGDDAVEMAYRERSSGWGNGIGVNLRVAQYTDINIRDYISLVRSALFSEANRHNATLISLPISHWVQEADDKYIRKIIDGYPRKSISRLKYNSPLDIIRKVGRCRVVITAAFHPAVFALSQGIPVVGLVKSKEYFNKFQGLIDEYGSGCQIVMLQDDLDLEKLTLAIESAWETAEQVRPYLLRVAENQINAGQAAYQKIYDLVYSRSQSNRSVSTSKFF
jgi:polysaccharide pyruvyl transferase WcaK-like protein